MVQIKIDTVEVSGDATVNTVQNEPPVRQASDHTLPLVAHGSRPLLDTEMMKTNIYTNNNNNEEFRPRSKSEVTSRPGKRPNFLNQLKLQRKMSSNNTNHRPISPLVQVPITIQENPKKEEDKEDTNFRPRSKSDAPNFMQRRNMRKNENPAKCEKSSTIHEETRDECGEDDILPQPRNRAATASKADEPEFRERAASLGQSARARVTSIVRKLRHRSSDSTQPDEKKKKIKYYVSKTKLFNLFLISHV
jgi:hypothetical protein